MEKITIIINEGNSSMKTWNALRIAGGMLGVDIEVEIFLLDDGVLIGKKGQQQVEGLKELNLAAKIKDLITMDVKVNACGTCLNAKGITQEDLVEGIKISTMMDLAKSIKDSKRVISF
ncbi:MAG: DsrE/DsrF/TusD sulfur relay family protein [bacterium]